MTIVAVTKRSKRLQDATETAKTAAADLKAAPKPKPKPKVDSFVNFEYYLNLIL